MAYMNQEMKKEIKAAIDATVEILGLKGKLKYSLAVSNGTMLTLNVKSGPIDFIGNYNAVAEEKNKYITDHMKNRLAEDSIDINPFWAHEHFTDEAQKVIVALLKAMNIKNYDNSDIQSDYFDIGYHVRMNIGKWNKPYEVK